MDAKTGLSKGNNQLTSKLLFIFMIKYHLRCYLCPQLRVVEQLKDNGRQITQMDVLAGLPLIFPAHLKVFHHFS